MFALRLHGPGDARLDDIPEPTLGTEDEVITYARENLANFKVPRRVVLVDELPLTPSMKVSKLPLREHAPAQLAEAR